MLPNNHVANEILNNKFCQQMVFLEHLVYSFPFPTKSVIIRLINNINIFGMSIFHGISIAKDV
jgi:hypothetical protein